MSKGTRLLKRFVALFMVLLLSIESFAAVVSDNDGSAFITKAEFDSLKNNFQSQIDQYNTSIDSKIDGTIALYISGIQIAKTEKKSIIPIKWGGYTILNGDIANTYAYPDVDIQIGLYNDYSTAGTSSTGSGGSRKVLWALGRLAKDFVGNRMRKVLVTNVEIGSTIDTSNMTWYGIAENMEEQWVLVGQWQDYTDDPGYMNAAYISNIFIRFCNVCHLTGKTGYIDKYSDVNNALWKPLFYWQGSQGGTVKPYAWSGAIGYSLSETPTVIYNKNADLNKTFTYEHLGNWKSTTSWEVNVKDEVNYLTVSPYNTLDSAGWFSQLTTNGTWSAMEVNAENQFVGMARRRVAKFTDGKNNQNATADRVPIPSLGLLANRYNASEIYQFERLVDTEGNNVPRITMEKGMPLMAVKENEVIEWEPIFSKITVPETTGNIEMKIVLSYKPFTNGKNTYTTGTTQDNNDYVKIDGFERGTFPTTTNGKVKIKFEAEHAGYIYAKWFPDISDSDIESKAWEATLDINNCSTYASTKE